MNRASSLSAQAPSALSGSLGARDFGQPFIVEWSARYLAATLYLALFASVIAFACYLTLLRRIGAARAGYATVLFPIGALAISTFVEDYRWTAPAVIGVALALAGNVLVLRRNAERR